MVPDLCDIWGRIFMATNFTLLRLLRLFFSGWKHMKDRMFQDNRHTIRELKTAIQLEIEAVSAETITRVLNNFVHRLHKVCDLRELHMEHVLVQQTNFPSV
jgi:hypothetical protein